MSMRALSLSAWNGPTKDAITIPTHAWFSNFLLFLILLIACFATRFTRTSMNKTSVTFTIHSIYLQAMPLLTFIFQNMFRLFFLLFIRVRTFSSAVLKQWFFTRKDELTFRRIRQAVIFKKDWSSPFYLDTLRTISAVLYFLYAFHADVFLTRTNELSDALIEAEAMTALIFLVLGSDPYKIT